MPCLPMILRAASAISSCLGVRSRVEPITDYWTDDRAPVEWITDRMIVVYGISGKDRAEKLLPTAPSS